MALQLFIGPWPLFQFLNPIHSRQDPLEGVQPIVRLLPTHRTTQIQIKLTQTLPRVGFEPTIPAFEMAKAVHALDCAATVIGQSTFITCINMQDRGSLVEVCLCGLLIACCLARVCF
jgi:hypothetical protein